MASATSITDALDLAPDTKWSTLGGGDGKPIRDELKQLVTDATTSIRHDVLARVLEVLVPLVLDEARQRYQAGNVSFDDILVLTRRLLHTHPRRARRRAPRPRAPVRRRVPGHRRGAVRHRPRARRRPRQSIDEPTPVLFAVGDPKQSIYGFRDADVTLFEQLRSDPQLAALQLTTNFRSRPEVLRFVNSVFRSWFAADEPQGQVPFSPLDAHVADGPSFATVVGGAIAGTADQVARQQADDIARVIATARGSWPCRVDGAAGRRGYTDIAVLVRTRADLVHLEPALRTAGIPYVVEGGALLYDTREVRDLFRVLRAVNDSSSPITVVNALRTSVLAISDVELVEHRRLGGRWNPYAHLDVPPERPGHRAVLQALTTLAAGPTPATASPSPT